MNCTRVSPLLSAYHDGELTEDQQSEVLDHVRRCQECAGELDRFQMLSELARVLPSPAAPGAAWQSIRDQLDQDSTSRRPAKLWSRASARWRFAALAASVLLAVGIGAVVFQATSSPESRRHGQFAADFGQYLERFQQDPDAAQSFLVAKYDNKLVEPEQAIHQVGYRPIVASGLPSGYTVASTYVMTMPCCTCVQSVCRREDGSSFAIFEHSDTQPMSFGDRRETRTVCAGKECCLVDLNNQIAASWTRGARHVTMIGARDRNEINQMVAWLDHVEAGE